MEKTYEFNATTLKTSASMIQRRADKAYAAASDGKIEEYLELIKKIEEELTYIKGHVVVSE